VELHTATLVSHIQSLGFRVNHRKNGLTQYIQFLDSVLNHAFWSQQSRFEFQLCLVQLFYDSYCVSRTSVDMSVSALLMSLFCGFSVSGGSHGPGSVPQGDHDRRILYEMGSTLCGLLDEGLGQQRKGSCISIT
jgi:hypothetical protein